MAEHFGFFNANNVDGRYDREYDAEDFANYFANFIGNGIFAKNEEGSVLSVSALSSPSMNVNVNPGKAWINGYWYYNDAVIKLPIEASDLTNSRIDSVVLRFDLSSRTIYPKVLKGTPATQPIAPPPVRDGATYDLVLAHVNIRSKSNAVENRFITDKRFDNKLCGIVHGVIDQIDTTTLGKQLEDWISNFEKASIAEVESIVDELNKFVDADQVGHLTNLIAANTADIEALKLVNSEERLSTAESNIKANTDYIMLANDAIDELDTDVRQLKSSSSPFSFGSSKQTSSNVYNGTSHTFKIEDKAFNSGGYAEGFVNILIVLSDFAADDDIASFDCTIYNGNSVMKTVYATQVVASSSRAFRNVSFNISVPFYNFSKRTGILKIEIKQSVYTYFSGSMTSHCFYFAKPVEEIEGV